MPFVIQNAIILKFLEMPKKFKSTLTPKAKRNGFLISAFVPKHIKQYVTEKATAENKTITQVIIAIITERINKEKIKI